MGIGLKKIYYPFDLGNTGLHNVKQFFFFFLHLLESIVRYLAFCACKMKIPRSANQMYLNTALAFQKNYMGFVLNNELDNSSTNPCP